MRNAVVIALMVLGTLQAFAGKTNVELDAVLLNNEQAFQGEVVRVKNCLMVFKVEGEKFFIPVADVKAVSFANMESKAYRKFQEAQADPESCIKGVQDASVYHGKGGTHFLLGALFGPFAVIGAAVSSPSPNSGKDTMVMSQNQDLFGDPNYLQCYKKKARGKNVGNTAIGWGAWVLLVLLI